MATRDLKSLIKKNTKASAERITAQADDDRAKSEAQRAFATQARANLTRQPALGLLDTIEPVDPSALRIQSTTRMPGETHKAVTVKMDKRLIAFLDTVSRKQNIAALMQHLVARGVADVLRDMERTGTPNYHESYDSADRNAAWGVSDPKLLALVAWIEKNGE